MNYKLLYPSLYNFITTTGYYDFSHNFSGSTTSCDYIIVSDLCPKHKDDSLNKEVHNKIKKLLM